MLFEDYLRDLRRDRFAAPAIAVCLRRTWRRIRDDMDGNPVAVRSIWSAALAFFAAAFVAGGAIALFVRRDVGYEFFLATVLAIVPTFTVVTLNVGLLRDRDGYALSAPNLPTLLTLLRVVMIPGIAVLLAHRQHRLALAGYGLAALSDVADGWLARRWNQTTPLGRQLDPVVDICFHLAIFVALATAGLLPPWVAWVAVARYGLLLIGGVGLMVFVGPVRIYPTLFGRLTGVVMAALVMLLLLLQLGSRSLRDSLTPLTVIALGVLLSATVAQVLVLGWYNLRKMRGEEPAAGVVGDVRWGPK
jgi:cardiolipin synthase